MTNTNKYIVAGDIAYILVKNHRYIKISTESLSLVKPFSWCIEGTGYAMSRTGKTAIKMHRLIAGAGKGDFVDHIDGDPLNNTKENLRLCRKQQNEFNVKRRSDNTSGYKGVCRMKSGKFRAYINLNGHQYHLGMFDDALNAAKAYNKKAQELFGEFARLNEILED